MPKPVPDGRVAVAWRVVPIAFALLLGGNVLALVILGRLGGQAEGERLRMVWQAPCAAQAEPVMRERGTSLGLGDPRWSVEDEQITLVATMPGLEDDRSAVPALLARPGLLEVRLGDQVLATHRDLASARLELDDAGMPVTQLTLQPEVGQRVADAVEAAQDSELVFILDGEELARRPNTIRVVDHQLKVIAGEGTTRVRMRRATDRAILLDHGALDCAPALRSVDPASASE
ncbi:hypothetical protein L6R53_28445 [Myxococcota bacterium]|nr:hypothetical protein [Myxococcota bacterium]